MTLAHGVSLCSLFIIYDIAIQVPHPTQHTTYSSFCASIVSHCRLPDKGEDEHPPTGSARYVSEKLPHRHGLTKFQQFLISRMMTHPTFATARTLTHLNGATVVEGEKW